MNTRHGLHSGFLAFGLLACPLFALAQDDASQPAGENSAGAAAASDAQSPPSLGAREGSQQTPSTPDENGQSGQSDTGRAAAPQGGQSLEQQVRDLRESNELLQQEVDILRREVRNLSNRLGDLSAPGGAAPRNLLGQMAVDEDFRRDVMRAIQGEVVIHNRTASTHSFFVNGVRWSVPPGKYVVWVPLGDVTAHLPDEPPQEFSNHWKLVRNNETGEPRHYRLWLNIGHPSGGEPIPATGVVAAR